MRYEGARTEVVRFGTHDTIVELTWIDHDAAGHPITFASTGEKGDSVTTCVWDEDRCVEMRVDGTAFTGDYDAAGLVTVRKDERVVWERRFDGFESDPSRRRRQRRPGWTRSPQRPRNSVAARR